MSKHPRFSVIVPVYNRPQEVEELLQSLVGQSLKDFEVLLIEDGSTVTSEPVFEKYASQLTIHYFFKANSGPGPSRNFGFAKANGQYFVVFDSDCVIPPDYFKIVDEDLKTHGWDAWGGPDRGHANFTPLQQAMAFTMSSVLTTGGIRGGKKRVGSFQPRSYNMGISREVFEKTGGFVFDRFAEDIEWSIRMKKQGFHLGLIPDAYVYHKRRATLKQFYRQVSNFGRGRILVGRAHAGEVKLVHWFPAFFTLGMPLVAMLYFFNTLWFTIGCGGYCVFLLALFADAIRVTKSPLVSLLALPAAWVQLVGYGTGFLREKLKV